MEKDIKLHNSKIEVELNGRFTFDDHEKFREVLALADEGDMKHMILNMKALEYVDSAALGMLLLLREAAEKNNINLVLNNPEGQVKKMIEVSKFDILFNIKRVA